jgi:hypothetical protein
LHTSGTFAPFSVSIRIAARSTPDTPSIMQWWVFETTANLRRESPSTI